MASRERSRPLIASTPWERFWFRVNNMLRPLAVPLAGGLSAAGLLFATLVPAFTPPMNARSDVPAVFVTQPILENIAPIGFVFGDAVVDLRIDEQGRIVNYSIVEESGHKDAVHRSIENSLLFTRFAPARVAPASCPNCGGVPIQGTFRMVFRNSSHIEVRG